MIRLNAFFTVKESVNPAEALALGNELVKASLTDAGCVAYGLFQSTADERVMMFCETWADDASLSAHAASAHFTRLVPMIEALTVSGLKLERFDF